jgi:recombinational DNA repair protein RecR
MSKRNKTVPEKFTVPRSHKIEKHWPRCVPACVLHKPVICRNCTHYHRGDNTIKILSLNTSSANTVVSLSATTSHNGRYKLPSNASSNQTGKFCAPSGGSKADTPFA